MLSRFTLSTLALFAAVLFSAPGSAAVIVITHSKALAGGITPADTPGYPVTLSLPGDYRLDTNLTVPSGKNGIHVTSNYVDIDMNGFRLWGWNAAGIDRIANNGVYSIRGVNSIRIYVTYTRFHLEDDGSSDSCPIQLSYTDNVPSQNPAQTIWQHTSVVPDAFGSGGLGPSANQLSTPVAETNGDLDIAYVIEECNTGLDHGLRFQKSTDGGATFLPRPVRVNKPGQWRDNPDLADLIPNTAFRTPNTVSLAYSQATGIRRI